jgi:hypothetical protein
VRDALDGPLLGEAALKTGDGALLGKALGGMSDRGHGWMSWGGLFMRTYKGILMAQHPRGVHETAGDDRTHGHLL